MKILLTGGGSGGHFYPIIAVAQSLNTLAREHKLIDVKLYYMAPQPYDERLLFENNITFMKTSAGKVRRYFSIMNFFDMFRTGWGTLKAIWQVYWLYPDVVFGKGGYVSFPALFAAWFLRIPVVIHESDSAPGRVNKWAGKFARKIAVSYPDAAEFFNKAKVAYTGNPVREELSHPVKDGSREFLHLEAETPVILFLGGSQGAQIINQTLLDVLPELVEKYQIIHQAGKANMNYVKTTADAVLLTSKHKTRYQLYDHLNTMALRMAAGASDLIVSRAGSTIFEIAIWNTPAVIVPITESNGDHQRKNAYSYARTGAAVVVEENNLTPHVLKGEIDRLMESPTDREKMKKAAQTFARLDSAHLIAEEILTIGLEHEK
jgi:UDP-N-acetylglucosamine--N-acetylmuramyl-(pentapeptide) pyrophosphoryl-undecaprenol N-acetylglucosamine transferase